jgi:uncharacterized membrane protein YfcA
MGDSHETIGDDMEGSIAAAESPRRYYTPWQIAVATLIGGSLAGGFFASRNYLLFGARKKAAAIAVVSVLVLIVAIVVGSRMPRDVPRSGFAFLIIIAYRWYAEGAFASNIAARQSEGWTRQSWWQIAWISAAFLVGMLVVGFLVLMLFDKDA